MAIPKRSADTIKRAIAKEVKAIEKHRDKLRDIVSEAENILGSVDDALVDLNMGLDTLSQYL